MSMCFYILCIVMDNDGGLSFLDIHPDMMTFVVDWLKIEYMSQSFLDDWAFQNALDALIMK